VDSRKTIHIGKLLHAIKVVRVLDGSRANVRHRFQGLNIIVIERVFLGAIQRQDAKLFTKDNQRHAHFRLRFRKACYITLNAADVVFNHASSRRQSSCCQARAG
jgi:hypothetical protein